MGWLEIFSVVTIICYAVFMLKNIFTLYPRKKNLLPSDFIPSKKISIIIPARNEEKNMVDCLQSIVIQDFPKELFEIIVVNDRSDDHTEAIATEFLKNQSISHKIISLDENEQGKKTAILKAIDQANGEIIVTRDADTISENKNWLKEIAFHFEKENCDLLLCPVLLSGDNSFSTSFQKYENLAISFLGLSMAKNNLPIVCSGANLAYKKEVFLELSPYANNMDTASGDDMFLLKAARKKKARIMAINNPVQTPAENGLKNALSQRLRWAAKTHKISILPVFLSGLILLLANIACLVALGYLFVDTSYLPFGLFTLTIKLLIDFLLLFLSSRMFHSKLNPTWYLPAFVLNLFYTPAVALVSVCVKPNWKGRKL